MVKVLLLGATGQLGKEWQDFFRPKRGEGVEVKTYSSSQLDLTEFVKVTEEFQRQQPDLVVNCAAFTDVDGAEERRDLVMQVNAGAVAHLASLSNDLGFRLVHYSTDYVFPGRDADRQKLPEGYQEDHPAEPINWYGRTKWEGEQAIRAVADDYLILRVSWLCGQYGKNFVKTMLQLGRDRDELQVVNDQWGSPTFARDVVENSYALLQEKQTGTFHITSKGLITWHELARAIFSLSKIEVEVHPVTSEAFPTKAERPRFSKLDTRKLEAVPQTTVPDWKESLRQLLRQLDI